MRETLCPVDVGPRQGFSVAVPEVGNSSGRSGSLCVSARLFADADLASPSHSPCRKGGGDPPATACRFESRGVLRLHKAGYETPLTPEENAPQSPRSLDHRRPGLRCETWPAQDVVAQAAELRSGRRARPTPVVRTRCRPLEAMPSTLDKPPTLAVPRRPKDRTSPVSASAAASLLAAESRRRERKI